MSERDPQKRGGKTARPRGGRPKVSPARRIATTVLLRVVSDSAYAVRALDAELAREKPDPRDARLASEIVYGSLRVLPELDAALLAHLSRGKPEPFTWAALRVAAYQALHLGRVPSFAIAQETVALVRSKRGEGLSRLTNAVLRRLLAQRPEQPEPPQRLCVPAWVDASLRRGLGDARAACVLEASEASVPLGVRAVGVSASELAEQLRAALPEARVEASPRVASGLRVRGGGDPRRWPGYAEGRFAIQDEGAQALTALVDAQPGMRVWDACAGRGGKTLQLAEQVGESGQVVASDLYPEKLESLEVEAQRLGLDRRVVCQAANLELGTGGVEGPFDRVLVDAPCTGLGTIRRRPEILLRLTEADPSRMAELQLRLLRRALGLVRPGGRLVFATCSPTYEEGAGVVEGFQREHSGLRAAGELARALGLTPEDSGIIQLGPWLDDAGGSPDVYQAICWDCP